MRRLLTHLMIFILVMAHGTSVTAAICQHESLREHAAARQSHDAKRAVIALREDAAASVEAKKVGSSDSGSVSWPTDMLPATALHPPLTRSAAIRPIRPELRNLPGDPVAPLLEPPTA